VHFGQRVGIYTGEKANSNQRVDYLKKVLASKNDVNFQVLGDDVQIGFFIPSMAICQGVKVVIFKEPRYIRILSRYGFAIVTYDSEVTVWLDKDLGAMGDAWNVDLRYGKVPIIEYITGELPAADNPEKHSVKAIKTKQSVVADLVLSEGEEYLIPNYLSRGELTNGMWNVVGRPNVHGVRDAAMISSCARIASSKISNEVRVDGVSNIDLIERKLCGQSVIVSYSLSTNIDMKFKKGWTYQYLKDYDAKVEGQKKLSVSDFSFIADYHLKRVLVVGGAPGEHWLPIRKGYGTYVVLVDPRETTNGDVNIKEMVTSSDQIMDLVSKFKIDGLIWDVRLTFTDKSKDERIEADNDLFIAVLGKVSYLIPCSIKFRMTRLRSVRVVPNFISIQPQAHKRTHSFESRLILGPGGRSKAIRREDYDGWMTMINTVIANKGDIAVSDYLLSKRIVYDYLMPNLSSEIPVINVYSLSNNMIGVAGIKKYINMYDKMFVGVLCSCTIWAMEDTIYRGRMIRFGQWCDEIVDYYELQAELNNCYFFSLQDAVAWVNYYHPLGNMPIRGNMNCREAWRMAYIIKGFDIPDVRRQSWINAQTHFVKMVTPILRDYYGLDDKSLHHWRLWAMKIRYPDSIIYDDFRVNGKVDGKLVAVAGHLINMMMASYWWPIDVKRYMEVLEDNIINAHTNDFSADRYMVATGTHAEYYSPGLWHTTVEYQLAIDTYQLMVKHGLVPGNKIAIRLFKHYFTRFKDTGKMESMVAKERARDKTLFEDKRSIGELKNDCLAMLKYNIGGYRQAKWYNLGGEN
jgi:hypothetical protein